MCYFCQNLNHVTQNCQEFQTLRQRNFIVQQRKHRNCLCKNPIRAKSVLCLCEKVCKACFQHHHIAMCPKRDPFHPLYPNAMPESFNLFMFDYAISKRFFELCNPVDQFKLQSCCKFFKNLQPIKLKLVYQSSSSPRIPNIVFNGIGNFQHAKGASVLQLKTKNYFNFDCISLNNCSLNEADLKFLSKNDPYSVSFNNCVFPENFSLKDTLNAFQYASEFKFIKQTIPPTWILYFLSSDRRVDFRRIEVEDRDANFDFDDMIDLFEQNKNLSLAVNVKTRRNLSDIPKVKRALTDQRFAYSFNYEADCSLRFSSGRTNILLDYKRSAVFINASK